MMSYYDEDRDGGWVCLIKEVLCGTALSLWHCTQSVALHSVPPALPLG